MSTFSLENEPFPQGSDEEFYFSTPALAACLADLGEALHRGHVLLVDEEASGKSTMLEKLAEAHGEQWRIFRLQARERRSAKDLLHDLMSAFGLPIREPAAAELRDADTLLELLSSRSQLAVVIIDDAHRLERDALEQLLYLARRWQAYGVRFLICAEPALAGQLASLDDGARLPEPVATLAMPRFGREQVSDYLHLCLYRAGLSGDSPFDPAGVAAVTDKAEGLVGAIKPAAREFLEAGASNRLEHDTREQLGARRWPGALAAVAGLGVLLMVALAAPGIPQADEPAGESVEVFRSSITLTPLEGVEGGRGSSATADSVAP